MEVLLQPCIVAINFRPTQVYGKFYAQNRHHEVQFIGVRVQKRVFVQYMKRRPVFVFELSVLTVQASRGIGPRFNAVAEPGKTPNLIEFGFIDEIGTQIAIPIEYPLRPRFERHHRKKPRESPPRRQLGHREHDGRRFAVAKHYRKSTTIRIVHRADRSVAVIRGRKLKVQRIWIRQDVDGWDTLSFVRNHDAIAGLREELRIENWRLDLPREVVVAPIADDTRRQYVFRVPKRFGNDVFARCEIAIGGFAEDAAVDCHDCPSVR